MTCRMMLKRYHAVEATLEITAPKKKTPQPQHHNIKQQLKNQKDWPGVSRLYHDTELCYAITATLVRTATTKQQLHQHHLWGS